MNNLLPKSLGEFSETAYWEHFFKTRSNSFEWYGEYISLIDLFQKYVKIQDNILVVGCGNSTLSEDLYLKHKCKRIISIDTSATAITQMIVKNKDIVCPLGSNSEKTFDFLCTDACKFSTYETINATMPLSCVIDKGTTDAIHSGGASSDDVLESMWSAIEQSLTMMGRYILITLAQEHIVESIVNFFTSEKLTHGWMINVHELAQSQNCNETFKLPIFAFVFYKMKPSVSLPLVYIEENSFSSTTNKAQKTMLKSPKTELTEWVLSRQRLSMLCNTIREAGRNESEIDMVSPKTGLTRYHCVLVHNKVVAKKKGVSSMAYCVFIVPLGHDNSPIFEGERSRLSLCRDHLKCRLCLFVYLNPREYYESKQSIQDELHSVSLKFCPAEAPRQYSIPVLSSSEQVCTSDVIKTGLFVTETVTNADNVSSRRLVAPSSDRPVLMATVALSLRDSLLGRWLKLLPVLAGGPRALYLGQPGCTEALDSHWTVLVSQHVGETRSFVNGRFVVSSSASSDLDECVSGNELWPIIVSDNHHNDHDFSLFTQLTETGVMIVCSATDNLAHTLVDYVRLRRVVTESFARDITYIYVLSRCSATDLSSLDKAYIDLC